MHKDLAKAKKERATYFMRRLGIQPTECVASSTMWMRTQNMGLKKEIHSPHVGEKEGPPM